MSHLSSSQLAALTWAARDSASCEQATGVPAELTLPQWALESAWGMHQPGNNCFGIKAYKGCFGVQSLKTVEYVNGAPQQVMKQFATFASIAACFNEHAALISQSEPFAKAWAVYRTGHDLNLLIRSAAAIYATEPTYADLLLRIAAMPEVKAALVAARSTPAA